MDRNKEINALFNSIRVALLAEGVDRNLKKKEQEPTPAVALLAEGVDRNMSAMANQVATGVSPSSRRAWIEIKFRSRTG